MIDLQKATEMKLKVQELKEATRLFPRPDGPGDTINLAYLGVEYEIYARFAKSLRDDLKSATKEEYPYVNEILSIEVDNLSPGEKAELANYHRTKFAGIKDPRAWALSRLA